MKDTTRIIEFVDALVGACNENGNPITLIWKDPNTEKEEKFIVAVAKNATTRINRALDEREIDELLQRLLVLENPFDTEHGSITAIKMSRADIEKKFSRRK